MPDTNGLDNATREMLPLDRQTLSEQLLRESGDLVRHSRELRQKAATLVLRSRAARRRFAQKVRAAGRY